MADPFLGIDDFATQFGRDLSEADNLVATRLLQVVSDWIRDHAPADVSEDAAEQVVFEVTRDALLYGDFGPVTSLSRTVGPRTKDYTVDRSAVEKFITDRQRRMLGISLRASPRGNFTRVCPPPTPCWPPTAASWPSWCDY